MVEECVDGTARSDVDLCECTNWVTAQGAKHPKGPYSDVHLCFVF